MSIALEPCLFDYKGYKENLKFSPAMCDVSMASLFLQVTLLILHVGKRMHSKFVGKNPSLCSGA